MPQPPEELCEGPKAVHELLAEFEIEASRKIADPSFFNWPALPVALTGVIVPDFPWSTRASTSPTAETTYNEGFGNGTRT